MQTELGEPCLQLKREKMCKEQESSVLSLLSLSGTLEGRTLTYYLLRKVESDDADLEGFLSFAIQYMHRFKISVCALFCLVVNRVELSQLWSIGLIRASIARMSQYRTGQKFRGGKCTEMRPIAN